MENIFPLFRGDLGIPKYDEAIEAWVPIEVLWTQQRTLSPARMKATDARGLPVVFITPREQHIIIDGNHRLANDILTGRLYRKVLLTPTRY